MLVGIAQVGPRNMVHSWATTPDEPTGGGGFLGLTIGAS
jgi:hypothetical protein